MAKKNYQKVTELWEIKIKHGSGDNSIMTINGKNSNDTMVEISVSMEDFWFPIIISNMATIGRKRVASANDRMKTIVNAVNEQ